MPEKSPNMFKEAASWVRSKVVRLFTKDPAVEKQKKTERALNEAIQEVKAPKPKILLTLPERSSILPLSEGEVSSQEDTLAHVCKPDSSGATGVKFSELERRFAEIPIAQLYILNRLLRLIDPNVLWNLSGELASFGEHRSQAFGKDIVASAEYIGLYAAKKLKKFNKKG